MGENQNIDLQKLSQKELLIITYRKVEDLSGSFDKVKAKQEDHEVKLAVIDTKVKTWAVIVAAITALAIELISNLFKN